MRWKTAHRRKRTKINRAISLRKVSTIPVPLFRFSCDTSKVSEDLRRFGEAVSRALKDLAAVGQGFITQQRRAGINVWEG